MVARGLIAVFLSLAITAFAELIPIRWSLSPETNIHYHVYCGTNCVFETTTNRVDLLFSPNQWHRVHVRTSQDFDTFPLESRSVWSGYFHTFEFPILWSSNLVNWEVRNELPPGSGFVRARVQE